MRKIWLQFFMWATLGWFYLDIRYIGSIKGAFVSAGDSFNNFGFFIGIIMGVVSAGLISGSAIFGIWYAFVGRKKISRKLVVLKMADGSKASISGVKVKDIIVKVCDKDVKTLNELLLVLKERDKSKLVQIALKRGKDIILLEISLDENEKLGLNFEEEGL